MTKNIPPMIHPKNLSQLRRYTKGYQVIFPGLKQVFNSYNNQDSEQILVHMEKIRDFHSILKTVHSCIIGLGTTIHEIVALSEKNQFFSIFATCLKLSYSYDKWNNSLLYCIFDNNAHPLIRLFLWMMNTQVQVVRETSIMWLNIREFINESAHISLPKSIPIKIRLDIYQNASHTITTFNNNNNNYYLPIFSKPTIIGLAPYYEENKTIYEIHMLYHYENNLVDISPMLKGVIKNPLPFTQHQVMELWEEIDKQQIFKRHHSFVLQSILSMLSPNLI